MAAKQATYGDYVITKEDNGKIVVTKGGEVCPNSTRAMREISAQIGYTVDDSWNTQQFGAKLIAQLQGEIQSPAPIKEVSTTPAEEKKDLPNVKASAADIAGARVRVYGKAQNRTALGIMHAYMVMYPQSKLEDIQKAFPDTLNPDSGVKKNFIYAEEKGTTTDWNGFFKKEEELLTMGDGRKVAVVSMWTKPSFERLVAWAKQYGIIVAEFEAVNKGGEKGGFRLEYLNGYIPPKPRKGIPVNTESFIDVLRAKVDQEENRYRKMDVIMKAHPKTVEDLVAFVIYLESIDALKNKKLLKRVGTLTKYQRANMTIEQRKIVEKVINAYSRNILLKKAYSWLLTLIVAGLFVWWYIARVQYWWGFFKVVWFILPIVVFAIIWLVKVGDNDEHYNPFR